MSADPLRPHLRVVAADGRADERSDEALMAAYRLGDGRAFEVLVLRHRRPVFGFLLRMGLRAAPAEEVLADVFLKVHRAASTYEPTARFTTWLYTVARRAALNALNKHGARREVPLGGAAEAEAAGPLRSTAGSGDDPESLLAARRSVALVDHELRSLPEGHRDAFILYYAQGLDCGEVAAVLAVSSAEVKGRLAYARKLLRTRLAGRVPEASSSETTS